MTDSSEQQEAALSKNCIDLRRLVAAVKPDGFQTIVQEVARIESGALTESLDEFHSDRPEERLARGERGGPPGRSVNKNRSEKMSRSVSAEPCRGAIKL